MMNFRKQNVCIMMFLIMLPIVSFSTNTYAHEKSSREFIHGITIKLHHGRYYFAGPPDGPNGESDVPGHSWLKIGKNRFLGKHVNTGPFGAESFWSSDAGDGALLYAMETVIDHWTEAKALKYYTRGFIHYHTLVNVETGQLHPKKVAWFKHVAVKTFELDAVAPLAFLGVDAYTVMPGVDYLFGPNWDIPYDPTATE